MPAADSMIQFKYGLEANYNLIDQKDANTLYFLTDSQRLFVGDTEYTRPIQHGTDLPEGYLPKNSLFVKEAGTGRELYYSKDGESWELISQLPATITGGVFGDNGTSVAAGGSIKVPKITVDNRGNITAVSDVSITIPADVKNTVNTTGSGNAVTSAEFDAAGHALTLTKGATFATSDELDAVEETANAAMPKSGGDFTGAVTVQAPTAAMNPAHKKSQQNAIIRRMSDTVCPLWKLASSIS